MKKLPKETGSSTASFTLDQFRRMLRAGAFTQVRVVAGWTHFRVLGVMQNGDFANLVTSRKGNERKFLNPAAALLTLKKIGACRVEVDLKEWDAGMASLAMRIRPDVTARRLRESRTVYQKHLKPDEPAEAGPADRREELMRALESKTRDIRMQESIAAGIPLRRKTRGIDW